MSLHRAEKLIDLACSTTHEEEARTAALTACKLIRKHGLRLTHERVDEAWSVPRRSRAASAPGRNAAPEPVRAKPPNGGAWTQARHAGRCENCDGSIAYGDDIYVVADVVWCGRH